MNILHITPYFLPHKGGIERYVNNLSKNLVDRGHNVTIYTANIPETKLVENFNGISIFRFNCIAEPLRNPIIPRLMFPTKNIQKYDLIHIHMLYSSVALYGLLERNVCGIPVVMTHYGQMRFEEKFKDRMVKLYEIIILRKILSICACCIALSESDAQFLTSFVTENRIKVIPNAIDSRELLHYSKNEINLFLKLHNLENKKIILFIGRLIPIKGINYLIEAFYRVKKTIQNPSVVLLIVGAGAEYYPLKQIVKEKKMIDSVIFFGEVSNIDINFLYQSSFLFVLPSLSEGFPTVVLEAMYYGIPVIGTDIPVMKTNFSESALLVPPSNSNALAEAILSLISDPSLTLILSIKAKEKVLNNFTWDIIGEKYLDIYTNIIYSN